jgi:hypothetical protein
MAKLVENGLVSFEDARARSKDPNEFTRLVNVKGSSSPAQAPTAAPADKATPQAPVNPANRGTQFRPGYQSK